jgi:hypothetical protein
MCDNFNFLVILAFASFYSIQNFLYKCLGIVLRISSKKDFVSKHLDRIFTTAKHTNQLEREVRPVTKSTYLQSINLLWF